MRLLRAILGGLLLLALAPAASAQQDGTLGTDPGQFPIVDSQSPILTVDIERLFVQTQFGERIAREYNDGRAELAAENRRIADALREEELALAEQRSGMDPEVFQAEAEAFDEKAQSIRRAQDAKEQELEALLATGREQFLAAARPVLGELLIERRASVILDQRGIIISLNRIDITDEAIARIDEAIGDGSEAGD